MQKDKIKVGDTVRIVKVGSTIPQGLIGVLCKVVKVYKAGYDILESLNNVEWYGVTSNPFYDDEFGILVEKVENKKERSKKVEQIEEVKEEKPFRMPTTSIRMFYRGQWKNCTSEDVELNWDMF